MSYYEGYNKETLYSKIVRIYKEEGFKILLKKTGRYIINYIRYIIKFTIFRLNYLFFYRNFYVAGKKFKYFINPYNAINSERVVEIPFAMSFLQGHSKIIEIGNVLNHYYPFGHTVVDKYERFPGVLNVDIIDFNTGDQFDLVISISTIEHIGFDETPRTPGKSLIAIKKIISLLKPGGMAIITVPLAYNPEIDGILKNGTIQFKEKYFLKRVSRFNIWEEATLDECIKLTYGKRFPHANAVAFLIYEHTASKDTHVG